MNKEMNCINQEIPVRDVQYLSRREAERKYQKQLLLMYGFFCLSGVVSLLEALCVTNDFLRLRKTWNIVETSNPIVVFITALTCAMLLNVSMLYFGIELKKYSQKLCVRSEMLKVGVMSCVTFLITYIFYFMFTMATRSSAYSMRSNGGFQLGGTSNSIESGENAILYIALYAAFLPLATSLFSVLAGYCSNNPLQKEINLCNLRIIDIQNNIMDLRQALIEAEEPLRHAQYLFKCETDKYKTFIENLRLQGLCLMINVDELIAKSIDTPEAYSELITKSRNHINEYKQISEFPHDSIDYIQNELIKKGLNGKLVEDLTNNDDAIIDDVVEGRSMIYEQ